ncbi:predicted oxidoreductases [Coriobacteriaceae bacterium EMTCatB1]|nr:predicted oxidoreductases [Coriobacteriaceae bacterium EMTCatB1]
MEKTTLPWSGQHVCRVALGTWSMGGWMWGGADERAARATIQRALEIGVDFVDTAPVYGFGLSERLLGEELEALGVRDRVVIATKCGLVWDERQEPWRDSSPASIRREVEASLERLKTSWIDLYLVHWPDEGTPFEETAAALQALVDEGIVRAVGVCNYSVEQMERFRLGGRLDAAQFRYNLFEPANEPLLRYARERGLVSMAYSPLARGLLTGAMRRDQEPTDAARRAPMYHGESYQRHLDAVERLDSLAQARYGRRVIHLAVRWLLDQPGMSVVLWGARRPEQLDAVDGVWGFSLDDDAFREIGKIVSGLEDPR